MKDFAYKLSVFCWCSVWRTMSLSHSVSQSVSFLWRCPWFLWIVFDIQTKAQSLPLEGGGIDYQNQLCVLFSSIFLCYRVYKVRGNFFQTFPMKFCPSTGRFKIGQMTLFWAYIASSRRTVNPIGLIFSPLVL